MSGLLSWIARKLGLSTKTSLGRTEEDLSQANWRHGESRNTGNIVKRAFKSPESDFLHPERTISQGVGNFRNRVAHDFTTAVVLIPQLNNARHPRPSNADLERYKNGMHNSMHSSEYKRVAIFSMV